MIIIWSKLSDIFGRKPAILATLSIFTAFSAGCGAAQTMTQL
jgi:MFS family permease